MSSNEPPSSTPPDRHKLDVEPRKLPEEPAPSVQPFQELNERAIPGEAGDGGSESIVRPRDLPQRKTQPASPFEGLNAEDSEAMREAMRLMLEEGHTREEAAARLKIEPLKLRHWENAYHEFLQKNLNEGDYHDTDAQLRDLPPEVKAKFTDNWGDILEKHTERRIKLSPLRSRLMAFPLTKWMFRNEYGQLDYATLSGVGVAILGLVLAVTFMLDSFGGDAPPPKEERFEIASRVRPVEHDGKAAAEIILKFHQTDTWEEKLAYVYKPEEVRPLMKRWYERFPERVKYERIGFITDQPVSEGDRNYLLSAIQVHKTIDAEESIPYYMALLHTENGYVIDWEISAGYQEMPLEEFREVRPTKPTELRLTIVNSDYFNYEFNDPEKYLVFEATYMGMERPFYLYAPATMKEAVELEAVLELKESMGVIVKARYPENSPADDQIELVELVSRGWFKQ